MTVQETAAYLLEQQKEKAAKVGVPSAAQQARHRTGKVRQYHQLLAEEAAVAELEHPKQESEEEEEEFEIRQRQSHSAERAKAEPVVVRKRRRRYDSSDDSSQDDEKAAPARRHDDDSSSSDGDSEADQRRLRLLKQRSQKQDEEPDAQMEVEQKPVRKRLPGEEDLAPKPFTPRGVPPSNGEKQNQKQKSSSEEESSSSEEDSSSSSDDDSSSEDDQDDPVIAKPLFVPKHKRGTVISVADLEAEEMAKEEKLKEIEERRKRESRAMVQQVVQASVQAAPDYENALEGITGARNLMPDDNDDEENADKARDAWEVRELERLMEDLDIERARQEEERELARRRQMTDEERLQEDIASGRYQRPGQQRQPKQDGDSKIYAQRYLHRGAYYMDEEEWDESDVRHKAAEYAQAATEADKVDRTKLPEVMKVKKFGFANQSRYKGLAAEDTTDRQTKMLPLVHDKKGKPKRR